MMADYTFCRCINCQCNLRTTERASKLLPCLHVLCLDCIYGRMVTSKDTTREQDTGTAETAKSMNSVADSATTEDENGNAKLMITDERTEQDTSTNTGEELFDDEREHKTDHQRQTSTTTDEVQNSDHLRERAQLAFHDAKDNGGKSHPNNNDAAENETGTTKSEGEIVGLLFDDKTNIGKLNMKETTHTLLPLKDCPECKEMFDLDTLIENPFVHTTLTTAQGDTASQGQKICTGCEMVPAAFHCPLCQDLLCDECVAAHKRVRMTKDHKLIPLKEAMASQGAGFLGQMSEVCSQHPAEKLTLFCNNCQVVTCRDCQLQHHQEHRYQFLEEAVKSYKTELKGSLYMMRKRLSELCQYHVHINDKLKTLKSQNKAVTQEILDQCYLVVAKIRENFKSILTSLSAFSDDAMKCLASEWNDVDDILGSISHCGSFMEAVLEDGSELPLLWSWSLIDSHFKKILHRHTQMECCPRDPVSVYYQHDVPSFLRTLSDFGSIYINGSMYCPRSARCDSSTKVSGGQNGPSASDIDYNDWSSSSTTAHSGHQNQTLLSIPTMDPPTTHCQQAHQQQAYTFADSPFISSQGLNSSRHVPVDADHMRHWRQTILSSGQQQQSVGMEPAYPSMKSVSQQEHQLKMKTQPTSKTKTIFGSTESGANKQKLTSNSTLDNGPRKVRRIQHILPASPVAVDQTQLAIVSANPLLDRSGQIALTMPSTGQPIPVILKPLAGSLHVSHNRQHDMSTVGATGSKETYMSSSSNTSSTTVIYSTASKTKTRQEVDAERMKKNSTNLGIVEDFTLDPSDDYCAACHQGGEVLCCDTCPRVFHLQCHVPAMAASPNGSFICTLCDDNLVLEGTDDSGMGESNKRISRACLSLKALRVCERVLLELFCHHSSLPFHEPVNRAVPNYYKIITSPMDFTNIKCKLSRSHFNQYTTVQSFLDDCKLVFKNCAVYNAETSEVGRAGKIVNKFFEAVVSRHLPGFKKYLHPHESAKTAPKSGQKL